MKMDTIKNGLLAACTALVLGSCSKALDKMPGTELDESQMYLTVSDADAAVMGLYGKFMGISDKYVVLNELRADLLESTENANEYLRQISEHNVSTENPYASPRQFYELIVNCNDVLKNFNIMREKNILDEAEFNQRYSDVGSLRSFLYLQVGIHYGNVPYITDPVENISQLQDPGLYKRLDFDVLLDSLINFTEALPFRDPYPTGTTLNIVLDAVPTQNFFIHKKCLLGDLHLWKGNYGKAATYYREVMETFTVGNPGEAYYSRYKLGWSSEAPSYVGYSRAGDATTLVFNDGWRTIFDRPYGNSFSNEWIWALPFDSRFAPENPLIKLFSPIGGNYLVRPSKEIISNWNNQRQNPVTRTGTGSGIPYDARGLLSVRTIGDRPVAMKYLYNYLSWQTNLPFNQLQRNGKWFLYRQTHLHLRFAEAANREGHHRLALGFLNNGIGGAYPVPTGITNVTPYQNTLFLQPPYNFDARNGTIPNFRAPWYRHIGIRARAGVTAYPITSVTDSLVQVENGILNEGALENAFEGTRWADLIRVAIRRNDASVVADKVFDKLSKEGNPNAGAVRARLMNKENWYLPFKW